MAYKSTKTLSSVFNSSTSHLGREEDQRGVQVYIWAMGGEERHWTLVSGRRTASIFLSTRKKSLGSLLHTSLQAV
jgi:hypothetical protein